MSNFAILSVFAVYAVALLVIGYFSLRRTRSMGDYVLGGRRIGAWVTAFSASASLTSAWTILVFPGLAFVLGLEILWLFFFIVGGTLLGWLVVAKRLRRYSIKLDALTISTFFERRFEDKSGVLRSLTAILTLFFLTVYVSSGLVGGASLLNTAFGISTITGMILTLLVIVAYTMIGGFLAVSRTDFLQAFLTVGALGLLAVVVLSQVNLGNLGAQNPELLNPFTKSDGSPITFATILTYLGWGLGVFGTLRLLARFKAIKSEKAIPKATIIAVVWIALAFGAAMLLGWGSNLYFGGVVPDGGSQTVFLELAGKLVPPVLTGFLLVAVIATIMSTADSQLLINSAVASEELPYLRGLFHRFQANRRLLVGRVLLVVFGLLALGLAIFSGANIGTLVAFAFGGSGAAFGPLVVFSLFWRRLNFYGALAGVIVGGVVAIGWGVLYIGAARGGPTGPGDIFTILPTVPGFLFASIAIVVTSLLTPKPSTSITSTFDAAVNQPSPETTT